MELHMPRVGVKGLVISAFTYEIGIKRHELGAELGVELGVELG